MDSFLRMGWFQTAVYLMVGAVLAFWAAAPGEAATLKCPPWGSARSWHVRHLNELKNRMSAPRRVDPAITLNRILAPGYDRHRWHNGSAATVTGYVVAVYEGGVETANCDAHREIDRDTHIVVALRPRASTAKAMIAEVTPRWRVKMRAMGRNWSTPALRRELVGHQVRITGWMLFDYEHAHGSRNTHPGNTRDWRATAWEIHPVTAIRIVH